MIPRTAHVIWIGDPIRAELAALVGGFERLHPEWNLEWWGEAEIDAFGLRNQELYDAAPDIVPADSVNQFRSDLARYEIIHRHGGLYMDVDFRWQHEVDDLLVGRDFVTVWEIQDRYAANGLFAAAPGHPILAEIIDAIPQRVSEPHPAEWRANRLTGTHVFTPVVQRHHAYVAPQWLFCAVPWQQPELADDPDRYPRAIAVHIWNHQRQIRG